MAQTISTLPYRKIRQKWLTIIILGAIVFIALLFRLHNLESRTIGHIEMYVPGIELPYELSDPGLRLTLWKTIAGTVKVEPHPPAYYILMFGWTKIFGTDILALRLPSVLFGVACIVLIYVLCQLEEDRFTGLLAAGMLAFNGLHIFWSQEAKLIYHGVLSRSSVNSFTCLDVQRGNASKGFPASLFRVYIDRLSDNRLLLAYFCHPHGLGLDKRFAQKDCDAWLASITNPYLHPREVLYGQSLLIRVEGNHILGWIF